MSTWLAFDAGSPVTSAAVARDGHLLAESFGESRFGPSLLHHLDATLRRSDLRPAQLDGIVALRGPGSFTGIRITLSTALGLRAGLETRVGAISNLAALALHALAERRAPSGNNSFLALVDALRDEWFVQEFASGERGLSAMGDPTRLAAASITPSAGTVLAAHGSQVLPAHLTQIAQIAIQRASALSPAVAIAGSADLLNQLFSDHLQALYLRAFAPRGVP